MEIDRDIFDVIKALARVLGQTAEALALLGRRLDTHGRILLELARGQGQIIDADSTAPAGDDSAVRNVAAEIAELERLIGLAGEGDRDGR